MSKTGLRVIKVRLVVRKVCWLLATSKAGLTVSKIRRLVERNVWLSLSQTGLMTNKMRLVGRQVYLAMNKVGGLTMNKALLLIRRCRCIYQVEKLA